MQSLINGFSLNIKAIKYFLGRPHLWKYCLIPICVSTILFLGIFGVSVFFLKDIADSTHPDLALMKWNDELSLFFNSMNWAKGKLYECFYYVGAFFAYILVFVLALLILWYCFSILNSIVMIPFLDRLSTKVEEEIRGVAFEASPWHKGLLSSLAFGIFCSIIKLFSLGLILFFSLIFPPFMIFGFLITAWFSSLETLDICMGRRFWKGSQKIAWIFNRNLSTIGLGSFSSILLLMPIVQIFQPIIAVIGAVFLWVRETPEWGLSAEGQKILNLDNALMKENKSDGI